MTAKELIKKVETYNKMSDAFGFDRHPLYFHDNGLLDTKVDDYNSFVKFLKEELVTESVNAILSYDGFEIGKRSAVPVVLEWWLGAEKTVYENIVFDWNY